MKKVYLNAAEVESHKPKEYTWHRRFGHLGVGSLQKLADQKLVKGFNYDFSKEIGFCQACIEGKPHKTTFPDKGGRRAVEPLELVHGDVCGKIETSSLGGGHYFLTLIDDNTRHVWMYILRSKDKVFEKFVEWKSLVENQSGRKLKTLRTDNGGEYTSNEFVSYLKKEGIRHEYTVPITPQQNGVAERMNKTLVEAVCSMLSDAKLPKCFWAKALATAVYLRNHSPTNAVQGKTPHEAWTNEKPSVDHLKVFGCLCYSHVAKDERQKLDVKARRCIMLGYGTETKAYRLYDIERKKVLYSRDVIFNEAASGKDEAINKTSDIRYVQLECLNDEEVHNDVVHDEHDLHEDEEIHNDVAHDGHDLNEPVVEKESVPELRCSSREKKMPDFYGIRVNVADGSADPVSLMEALGNSDKAYWKDAMEKEMKSLSVNKVWDLVSLPKGKKVIGSKWVFKTKRNVDGNVERYKARLVAQGFSQKYGQDYDETFSPVVRFESLRMIIALSVQHSLKLHQMDVTTAFLNGELNDEVYMKQPEGYVVKGKENLVCKLKKSIYGLKQSPRCWNSVLDQFLKKIGFVQATSDPCLYIASEGELFLIAVYVDDIVLAGSSDVRMKEVQQALQQKFQVKDLGELHYFLGVKFVQNQKNRTVWIGQQAYAEDILKKFGMEDAKTCPNSCGYKHKINSRKK